MFTVSKVRRLLWVWAAVELCADEDMILTGQRLRLGKVGAPVLDTRLLKVNAGDTFAINARWSDGYTVGDRVSPNDVANKLPLRLNWQTVRTA